MQGENNSYVFLNQSVWFPR